MSKNNESTITKYPKDVAVVITRSKNNVNTLSIASCLGLAKAAENESPYTVYNKFSRFIATIIVNGKSVYGNIPIHDIANLKKRYEYISKKSMDMELEMSNAPEDNHAEAAYTVKFFSGRLKGQTPAQVLLADENKETLQSQREWLVSNLNAYPNNKKIIDAIDNAFSLYDQGKLSASTTTSAHTSGQFKIYDPGMRPLRTKIREDGMWMVYEIKINWNIGYNYPVSFFIKNYYAPVKEDTDGTLNVQVASRDQNSETIHEIKMSAADFDDVLRKIDTNMRMFETMHASEVFVDSENARKANSSASKSNSGNEKSNDTSSASTASSSAAGNSTSRTSSSKKEDKKAPLKTTTLYSFSEIKERKTHPGDYSLQCLNKPLESGSIPGDAYTYNVVVKKDAIQKMNGQWATIMEKVNASIKDGCSTALHIEYSQGAETYNNTEVKVVYVHNIL